MFDVVLEHVEKSFGGQAVLHDVNVRFAMGDTVAVLGPSGCGKTTLGRIVMGLTQPDSGRVAGIKTLRFGCVFQEDRLCEALPAPENIALVLDAPRRAVIEKALAHLGLLAEDITKPVQELSGGQRRRVALVRALLAPGDFLVLDEAFKGLDAAAAQRALDFTWQNLAGRTLLMIGHSEEEAARCKSRLILP